MAPVREIPGFYYDQEKKKYFKIEKNGTAPVNSAWSAENVKRRKIEDDAAAEALRRMVLSKGRPGRSRALADPIMGGFLSREIGGNHEPSDMKATCFARGLAYVGEISLAHARYSPTSHFKYMYICPQGSRRLCGDGNGSSSKEMDSCTAFSSMDGYSVCSAPIPRDKKNGLVHRRLLDNYYAYSRRPLPAPHYVTDMMSMCDMKYHEPTNRILLPANIGDPMLRFKTFTPDWDANPIFDGRGHEEQVELVFPPLTPTSRRMERTWINTLTPAPTANAGRFTAVIGTDRGLAAWSSHSAGGADNRVTWITPPPSATFPTPDPPRHGDGRICDPPTEKDVFSADFQIGHPDVVLFGGRPGILSIADTRVQPAQGDGPGWPTIRCAPGRSALAHVRSVSEHNVLVAGTRDLMAIYDLRFVRPRVETSSPPPPWSASIEDGGDGGSSSSSRNNNNRQNQRWGGNRNRRNRNNNNKNPRTETTTPTTRTTSPPPPTEPIDTPVIRFPGYRNPARLDAGLAVDPSSGLVAAALAGDGCGNGAGNGTVAIFSAVTGKKLRWCREREEEEDYRNELGRGVRGRPIKWQDAGPVRCLQFQHFAGDRLPSLFVGERKVVKVYSFGGGEGIDVGEDDE